jgi:translation elongation factor EF-Ts
MDQPFIKDAAGKTRVKDLVGQVSAQVGERVVVHRFSRFQVGEGG